MLRSLACSLLAGAMCANRVYLHELVKRPTDFQPYCRRMQAGGHHSLVRAQPGAKQAPTVLKQVVLIIIGGNSRAAHREARHPHQ